MRLVFLLVILLVTAPLVRAAEPEALDTGEETGEESFRRHRVALLFGYTYVRDAVETGDVEAEKGVWVPTPGIFYGYQINEKWSVGGTVEVELSEYLIVDEDLRRDQAVLVAALALYEPIPGWEVFAGGGIEFETDRNLAVLRLGTGYLFELGEDGWYAGPELVYDFKEEFDTWEISVAVGKSL